MNERIRAREVRVIGADGEQLGIMTPQDATRKAREQALIW
jgi:Translation initiation factor 3 (IF-3)